MFKPSTLILALLLLVAAVLVGYGFRSIARRRKIRRLCLEAEQAIEQSRPEEALQALWTAERLWDFNAEDGGRKAMVSDLDAYRRILTLLARLPSTAHNWHS